MLVVAGFDKISERQIVAFKASDLKSPLATVGLDVSPAILIPFYDEDSSTIFLTGKVSKHPCFIVLKQQTKLKSQALYSNCIFLFLQGDSTVYVYEVTEEAPYLCPLSHHRLDTLHQGLSFLPKNICNIAGVEFARALRLTNNTIKPVSYTVPRIKVYLLYIIYHKQAVKQLNFKINHYCIYRVNYSKMTSFLQPK